MIMKLRPVPEPVTALAGMVAATAGAVAARAGTGAPGAEVVVAEIVVAGEALIDLVVHYEDTCSLHSSTLHGWAGFVELCA